MLHIDMFAGMSVVFNSDGALVSTSNFFKNLRKFVSPNPKHTRISHITHTYTPKSHRYIWGHRFNLCRSLHDMAKQMYDNKKYAPMVWSPLRTWCAETASKKQSRIDRLLSLKKTDKELHGLVAKCLWDFANGSNLPWGRSATQPNLYSVLPIHEKVHVPNTT